MPNKFHKLLKSEVLVYNAGLKGYEIFNINTGKLRNVFEHDTNNVNTTSMPYIIRAAVSSDGTKAYVADGQDPYMRIIDLLTGKYLSNPSLGPGMSVKVLRLSHDGTELAVGFGAASYLYQYDTTTLIRRALPVVKPTGTIYSISYSKDDSKIAAGHLTAPFLTIYDRASMVKYNIPVVPTSRVNCSEFSPNGSLFACGSESSAYFFLYNTSDWTLIATAAPVANPINDIHFSPNGQRIGCLAFSATSTTLFRYYDIVSSTWITADFTGLPLAIDNYIGNNSPNFAWLDNDTIVIFGAVSAGMQSSTNQVIYSFISNTVTDVLTLPLTINYGCAHHPLVLRKLSGTVANAGGTGLARTVRAYHRDTGELIGETVSNAQNGIFEMKVFESDPLIVMSVGQGTEVTEIFDSVVSAPWP